MSRAAPRAVARKRPVYVPVGQKSAPVYISITTPPTAAAAAAVDAKKPTGPKGQPAEAKVSAGKMKVKEKVKEVVKEVEDKTPLPIMDKLDAIIKSVESGKTTILSTPTGTGKTTQVPAFLARKGYTVIIMLPTRAATRTAHERVSGEEKDITVGYACHGDVHYKEDTQVVYATTEHVQNALIKMVKKVRAVPKKFVVMHDEAHHSSTENHTAMKFLEFMLAEKYPISVLISSATTEGMNFSGFEPMNIIKTEVRRHKITTHWHEEDFTLIKPEEIIAAAIKKVREIVATKPKKGGIVFVPGEADIDTIFTALEGDDDIQCYAACSSMPHEELMKMFDPAEDGRVKLVIATNVAESSITIPDICFVVDTCLQKKSKQKGRCMSLELEYCCKNSMIQRGGRGGRTGPGDYYPLCTEEFFERLPQYDESDFFRIHPYMPVLKLLAHDLNPQIIYKIIPSTYDQIVTRLLDLKLITKKTKAVAPVPHKPFAWGTVNGGNYAADSKMGVNGAKCEEHTYEVTDDGKAVPQYALSLDMAVVAHQLSKVVGKSDMSVIAGAIVLAMIEGGQNGLFWYPRESRRGAERDAWTEQYFERFRGKDDLVTNMNIFLNMIDESTSTDDRAYGKWAYENSMNNKSLKQIRKMFKFLIGMFYDVPRDIPIERWVFGKGKKVPAMTDLADEKVMSVVYKAFEAGFADRVYNADPYKDGLYISRDKKEAVIVDRLRAFSDMFGGDKPAPKRICALNLIEIKGKRFVSNLFAVPISKEELLKEKEEQAAREKEAAAKAKEMAAMYSSGSGSGSGGYGYPVGGYDDDDSFDDF